MPQPRIFENLIQNLRARAARQNFAKICGSRQNLWSHLPSSLHVTNEVSTHSLSEPALSCSRLKDIPLKNITHHQSRRVTNGQVYGQLRVWVLICLTALPSPLSALSSPSVSPLSLLSTHLALVVLEHQCRLDHVRERRHLRVPEHQLEDERRRARPPPSWE